MNSSFRTILPGSPLFFYGQIKAAADQRQGDDRAKRLQGDVKKSVHVSQATIGLRSR